VDLNRRTDTVDWSSLIRTQRKYTHKGRHVSFETFVAYLRGLIKVDFGLSTWLDNKRTIVIGADALATSESQQVRSAWDDFKGAYCPAATWSKAIKSFSVSISGDFAMVLLSRRAGVFFFCSGDCG
jgi:hypothetical protein